MGEMGGRNFINKSFQLKVRQRLEFCRWSWGYKGKIIIPQKDRWGTGKVKYVKNDGLLEMEMRAKKSSKWL